MDVDFVARVFLLALLAYSSLAQGVGPLGPLGALGSVKSAVPAVSPAGLPSASSAATDLVLEHAASRPDYAFSYGVDDPKSGNAQSHKEEREGDNVRGEYKVLEADGSVRTVTYTVDPKNGFRANVQRDPSISASFQVDSSSDIDSGPSDHADYFSGSSYHTDFDT